MTVCPASALSALVAPTALCGRARLPGLTSAASGLPRTASHRLASPLTSSHLARPSRAESRAESRAPGLQVQVHPRKYISLLIFVIHIGNELCVTWAAVYSPELRVKYFFRATHRWSFPGPSRLTGWPASAVRAGTVVRLARRQLCSSPAQGRGEESCRRAVDVESTASPFTPACMSEVTDMAH